MSESKASTQVVVGGVLSGLILLLGMGAMFALGSRELPARREVAEQSIPVVAAVAVEPYDGGLNLEVDGVVTPFREIQVSAQVPGVVQRKDEICRAGNFVRKGTPLIEIDPEEYALAVLMTEQQYEQALAEANELDIEVSNTHNLIPLAQREVELQQNELARLERLKAGVTESAVDQARRAVVIAENGLQTVQNRYRLLQAQSERMKIAQQIAKSQLDRAKLDLSRTQIVAPVDGVIVQDSIEQDAYVQKGTALFTIEDTSAIEIKTSLQVDEMYWLWQQSDEADSAADGTAAAAEEQGLAYQIPEAPATVTYRVAGRSDMSFRWQGVLKRYDGIGFDARTRTVPCRILVEDPRAVEVVAPEGSDASRSAKRPPALVRGMYVSAQIHLQPSETFVLVPEIAVQPGKMVWRIRGGKLERLGPLPLARLIDAPAGGAAAPRYWMVSAVESELSPGDRLVRAGLAGLEPGMAVREESPAGKP